MTGFVARALLASVLVGGGVGAIACAAPQKSAPATAAVAAEPSAETPEAPPVPAPASEADAAPPAAPEPVAATDAADAGAAPPAPEATAPSAPVCDAKLGWATIDERSFSVSLPCTLVRKDVHGIDSQVAEFDNATLSVSYDYGRYSDPLTSPSGSNVKVTNEVIGGQPARLLTATSAPGSKRPLFAAVHLPSKLGPGITLTMWAECATAADQATAKKIFRSIRFKKP